MEDLEKVSAVMTLSPAAGVVAASVPEMVPVLKGGGNHQVASTPPYEWRHRRAVGGAACLIGRDAQKSLDPNPKAVDGGMEPIALNV